MSNDTRCHQEPAWPQPNEKQVLQVFEQRCQDLCGAAKRRAGRPARVSWNHRCLAIMLCFVRGWNAQLEVWRLISSEWVGSFAPVQVCDQAISNRIERADLWMSWCFESASAWLRIRREPWQDRHLLPWATEILAADARTLDRLERSVPWLRTLTGETPDLLAGQISALFTIRRQQWERVQWWPSARDNCKVHFFCTQMGY